MLICGEDELAAPVLCPAESVPASGHSAPLGGLDDCAYKLGPGSHAYASGPCPGVHCIRHVPNSVQYAFLFFVCCWRVCVFLEIETMGQGEFMNSDLIMASFAFAGGSFSEFLLVVAYTMLVVCTNVWVCSRDCFGASLP